VSDAVEGVRRGLEELKAVAFEDAAPLTAETPECRYRLRDLIAATDPSTVTGQAELRAIEQTIEALGLIAG